MPPHVVTDIEIHFRTAGAEPLYLLLDEARGDSHDVGEDGTRRYHLRGGTDVYVIQPQDVRYVRLTQREDEEQPRYLGDGIAVIGETPEL